jgi:hypothetical protein
MVTEQRRKYLDNKKEAKERIKKAKKKWTSTT